MTKKYKKIYNKMNMKKKKNEKKNNDDNYNHKLLFSPKRN